MLKNNYIDYEYDLYEEGSLIHDYLEILYVLTGRMAVFDEDKNYVLKSEDFTVFNPFEKHEIYREKGSHSVSFLIDMNLLFKKNIGRINCNSALIHKSVNHLELIRTQLASILSDLIQDKNDRTLFMESKLLNLLGQLKSAYEIKNAQNSINSETYKNMSEILLYINRNFNRKLTAADVAEKFYISQSYFSKMFEKRMKVSFSNYLRNLRLGHSIRLLLSEEKKVIDIAEECGFDNVNTYINSFKNKYGMTPAKYRQTHAMEKADEETIEPSAHDRTQLYSLLRHASLSLNEEMPEQRTDKNIVVNIDDEAGGNKSVDAMFRMLNMGYAVNFLDPYIQELAYDAKSIFDFEYLYLQGILDDEMSVAYKEVDGTLSLRFNLTDIVIDNILKTGMLPWLELSRTPSLLLNKPTNVFRDGYVQLPDDLNIWNDFIRKFISHYVNKYGKEEVNRWRFSIFPGLYITYGVFSFEEYMDYYNTTYNAIKAEAEHSNVCGGIFDIRLLQASWNKKDYDLITRFLKNAGDSHTLPDLLGIQCFHVDYSQRDAKETEARLIDTSSEVEPVIPTADQNSLEHDIILIQEMQKKAGTDIPLAFVYWNSAIWYRDLGNDTCHKSAFIIKNALTNSGKLETLAYGPFYDQLSDSILFGGGYGVYTEKKIPKASFYAMKLLKEVSDCRIFSSGDGYCVLKKEDNTEFDIVLYHYCHYDLKIRFDEILPREEQITLDRYYGFVEDSIWNMNISIKGLKQGSWTKEEVSISRQNGSSFDQWKSMGAPECLTDKQRDYLKKVSEPKYSVSREYIANESSLKMSVPMTPHEVKLIHIAYEKQ